jgi:hypothetical protein
MGYRELSRMEIIEVIRRWQLGESRAIARASGVARETVRKYLRAAEELGVAGNARARPIADRSYRHGPSAPSPCVHGSSTPPSGVSVWPSSIPVKSGCLILPGLGTSPGSIPPMCISSGGTDVVQVIPS